MISFQDDASKGGSQFGHCLLCESAYVSAELFGKDSLDRTGLLLRLPEESILSLNVESL